MTTIYDALVQEAQGDLEVAKGLKDGPYSQALYLVEQSLEKSCKAFYSYLRITRDNADDYSINTSLKGFGHNNTKMIPEIYRTICEIENREIDNIPESSAEHKRVKTMMKEKLLGLRISVETLIGKAPSDQNELLTTYPLKVHTAYNQYKRFELFIAQKAKDTIRDDNLAGTEKATQPHAFELFFGISRLLFPCIFIKNDIYRYPLREYKYENLQILNKTEMQKPCTLIIEMTNVFVGVVPKLMEPGLLALA